MDMTIKIFQLIEKSDTSMTYGLWALKTSIPDRYIQMIVNDIIDDVKCEVGNEWCIDDIFDRLPPEWEAKSLKDRTLFV